MKRQSLLILLFLLVAGAGLFVWNVRHNTDARTFRLADGSQLTFRAVTVGTNHTYCFGNVFQRIAARIPGKLFDKLLGDTVVNAPAYSATHVVFWFHVRKHPDLASFDYIQLLPNGAASTLYRIQPLDAAGNRLQTGLSGARAIFGSGDLGEGWAVTNLPPTLPTIRLKLSIWRGPEHEHDFAELTTPNPLYKEHSERARRAVGLRDVAKDDG
jgi:hypothetical protein